MDIKTYVENYLKAEKSSKRIKLKIGNVLDSDKNALAFFARNLHANNYDDVFTEASFYNDPLSRRDYAGALVELAIREPDIFSYTQQELNDIVDVFNDNAINSKFFDQVTDMLRSKAAYTPAFVDKEVMMINVFLTDPLFKKWYPLVTAKDYMTYYNIGCDNISIMIMTLELLKQAESGKIPAVPRKQEVEDYLTPILYKKVVKFNDRVDREHVYDFIKTTVLADNSFRTLYKMLLEGAQAKEAPKAPTLEDKINDILSFL